MDNALLELKRKMLDGDNSLCFIERETILRKSAEVAATLPFELRYQFLFGRLLAEISCPVDERDAFLGRMLEGPRPDDSIPCPFRCGLETNGHMTLSWPTLLKSGLSTIARNATLNAERIATEEARLFASNANSCVESLVSFAKRYSQEAIRKAQKVADPGRKAKLLRAAAALGKAPEAPHQLSLKPCSRSGSSTLSQAAA
jgi:hypothetical protein